VVGKITERYRRGWSTPSSVLLSDELSANVSFASAILIYANRRAANDATSYCWESLASQQRTTATRAPVAVAAAAAARMLLTSSA